MGSSSSGDTGTEFLRSNTAFGSSESGNGGAGWPLKSVVLVLGS